MPPRHPSPSSPSIPWRADSEPRGRSSPRPRAAGARGRSASGPRALWRRRPGQARRPSLDLLEERAGLGNLGAVAARCEAEENGQRTASFGCLSVPEGRDALDVRNAWIAWVDAPRLSEKRESLAEPLAPD